MAAETIEKLYTPAEYIAMEEAAVTKSEYINGRIYAMSGASYPHIIITGNTFREIGNQLGESECEVFNSDMRIKISTTESYVYPDITVACGEKSFDSTLSATLRNPKVVIEVLSPSTEAYDRGDKFAHYQLLPSLQEYVLISQNKVRIERYTRDGDEWKYIILDHLDATMHLASLNCHIPLRIIYRKVEFPALPELAPPAE